MARRTWHLSSKCAGTCEQEAAGEAGFDDLTAYTQIKLPTRIKLELARNYWDEMGRGNEKGMHGPMLERLVGALDLRPTIEGTAWQSLALANAMTAMATQPRLCVAFARRARHHRAYRARPICCRRGGTKAPGRSGRSKDSTFDFMPPWT